MERLDESYRLQADVVTAYILPIEAKGVKEGYEVLPLAVLRNLCGWRGIRVPQNARKAELVTRLRDSTEETCAARLARLRHLA